MSPTTYQFGAFALDLDRQCLRGPAGVIELRPKSFDVLHHLLRHAGGVVSKEQLMAVIWPNVTVTDDSLTRCISEVRRAIGDDGQQILKTVPRRGYVFDWPVVPGLKVAAGPSASIPDRGAAAGNDHIPFIAVLAFTNLSGKAEEDYFSDGITEDIITELSRFHELRVIARHSSFQFKGKVADVR